MTPEAKLLAACVKELKLLKAGGRRVWWVKLHGSAMMTRGLPDLYVLIEGRSLWIELKAPGNRPSPLQWHRIGEIQDAGGESYWCDTLENFKRLLET